MDSFVVCGLALDSVAAFGSLGGLESPPNRPTVCGLDVNATYSLYWKIVSAVATTTNNRNNNQHTVCYTL